MNLLLLLQDKLRYMLFSIILLSIITCRRLSSTFAADKHTKQNDNRSSNKKPKLCNAKILAPYLGNELHWAVIHCNKNFVEELFQHNSATQIKRLFKQKDSWGFPPVHWCFNTDNGLINKQSVQKKEHLYIFERFLENPNFNILIRDKLDRNVIHWAVITNYVEIIKLIFNTLKDKKKDTLRKLSRQTDSFGYRPLHYLVLDHLDSCTKSHSAILQYFLNNDVCDINAKDAEYFPLLYFLIDCNRSKLVEILLVSGQLETFKEFIANALEPSYSFRFRSKRKHLDFEQLSVPVKAILKASVKFLNASDQTDLDVINTKKMFLKRYFGIDSSDQPINEVLDILRLVLASCKFDEIIKQLEQCELLAELKQEMDHISKIFDCPSINLFSASNVLSSIDQGNNIIVDAKQIDEQKVKDFIEYFCQKYAVSTQPSGKI